MKRSEFNPSLSLSPMTRAGIDAQRTGLERGIRESGHAVVALAAVGVTGVLALFFASLSPALKLGAQEIIAFAVFSVATLIMYERAEMRIRRTEFEPVDLSDRGEVRALLNVVPEGRAYWQSVQAEARTFVGCELAQIRERAAYLASQPRPADHLVADPAQGVPAFESAAERFEMQPA